MIMREDFFMSIGDDDLISKVLNSFPTSYEDLVESTHIQMNSITGISLYSLKGQLRMKYQRIKKSIPRKIQVRNFLSYFWKTQEMENQKIERQMIKDEMRRKI